MLGNGSSAPGAVIVILLLVASYVAGHFFEVIRSLLLDQKFYSGAPDRALAKIRRKLEHSNIQVEFNFDDWSIYQEGLRVRNDNIIGDSERYKADALMMRNLSFGGLLYAVMQLVAIALNMQDIYRIMLVFLGLIIGWLGLQRAKRFDEWYYRTIYTQALMYGSNLKSFLENSVPEWNSYNKKMFSRKKLPKQEKSDTQ